MTYNEMLNSYNEMKEICDSRIPFLCSEQSKADKRIVDIQHEIEFGNYDACSMVMVFKDLKETLEVRRKLKNEIQRLQQFSTIFKNSKHINNSSSGLDGRKYNPRTLKLDFTNSSTLLRSRKLLQKK